jgi:hypothetical protein
MRVGNYLSLAGLYDDNAVLVFKSRLDTGAGLFLYTATMAHVADCTLSTEGGASLQVNAFRRRSCYSGIHITLEDPLTGKGPCLAVSHPLDKS